MTHFANHDSAGDRAKSALAVAVVHLAIAYALLSGLAVPVPHIVEQGLALFTVAPPKPPHPPEPRARPAPRPHPNGAAAPPNLKSKATELVAPPPVVVVPVPPPVIVADKASTGAERTTGAAPIAGPGTGSGGEGSGTGNGTGGNGDGGGGGGSGLRQIGGRISYRDYPPGPLEAHVGGTVWVRYVVDVRGRVAQCGIQKSSGNAELDRTTCRLIVERFRFKPQRDARNKPVPGTVIEDHTWVVDDGPREEER